MGGPSSQGLATDVPPVAEGWLERSGVGFAVARRESGKPGDPLLFALLKAHRRMHDRRRVDAAERERIAEVVVAPRHPAPTVPMVEGAPDDEAPSVLARRLTRRSRNSMLVPADPVTGFVPQWKREERQWAVGRGQSEGCDAAATVVRPDEIKRSGAWPDARETAADATCKAVTAGETAPFSPLRASEMVGGFPVAAAPCHAEVTGSQGGAANAARGERRPPQPDVTAGRDPHPKSPRPKRVPSIEHVIAVAERHAGLAPGGLGLGRAPAVTAARQVAMWLAFTLLQWDLARIGATFGRDRTTVRYAVKTVAERAECDEAFADAIDGLVAEAKAEPRTRRRKIAP